MIRLGKRISYAFRCFLSLLLRGEVPADLAQDLKVLQDRTSPVGVHIAQSLAAEARQAEKPPAESYARAIQMLALLQREGRLIDFLTEDVSPYPDWQLGAAVRALHEGCRKALDHYFTLEPIMASEEGESVTVQPGFNPSALKLIGNVIGKPPLSGLLRHRGWRVTKVDLPPLPQEGERSVIVAAEIEIP